MKKKVGVVILCGACVGQDITKLKKNYPGRHIYAIEPWPNSLVVLRERYGKDAGVTIIAKAAWISAGPVPMHNYSASNSHSLLRRPRLASQYKGTIEVEAFDLAEFLKGFDRIEHLMMDMEGSEYEVLRHCLEQGALDKVEVLQVELHAHKIPVDSGLEALVVHKLENWGETVGHKFLSEKL